MVICLLTPALNQPTKNINKPKEKQTSSSSTGQQRQDAKNTHKKRVTTTACLERR